MHWLPRYTNQMQTILTNKSKFNVSEQIRSCVLLAENKWTHITCVYNAKTETAIIFMNGEPIEQVEEVPTNRYVKQIMLGGDVFQPSFRGHMCELVIYNEAKDYEFVKNMFNSYVEREGFTKDFSNM